MRVATLLEWPDVVGSLDSIALTLALINPSNRIWTDFMSFVFFMATEA